MLPPGQLPDFSDTAVFPSFADLPESAGDRGPAGDDDWFLVAEVREDMTITKPTLVLADRSGAPFALVFDGLARGELDLKKRGLRKGHTAVVPRALRAPPREDGRKGFVRIQKDSEGIVKAVPAPLSRVFALAEEVREKKGGEGCAACGEKKEGLMRCTGCSRVVYCSTVSPQTRGDVKFGTDGGRRLVRPRGGMRTATRPTAGS